MASLDAAYDSDSDSHGEATFAVKGRRLSLEEVLAEVENKPPPIGSGGDEFASPRQRSASSSGRWPGSPANSPATARQSPL